MATIRSLRCECLLLAVSLIQLTEEPPRFLFSAPSMTGYCESGSNATTRSARLSSSDHDSVVLGDLFRLHPAA